VAAGKDSFRVLRFPHLVSLRQCRVLISIIIIIILSEGQAGEDWEALCEVVLFGLSGKMERKILEWLKEPEIPRL
jgi:hypothetical protein